MTAALDRIVRLAAAGALAAVALWVPMSLTYPLGWDQGIFAWAGGVIVDGGLPYRDAWDLKGPLVYYVYAIAQWIFGAHLLSVRVIDAVALAFSCWAVLRVLAALTDRTFARFGAIFFALWYASFSYWHTAQPDGWSGMLMIGVAAALIARPAAITSSRAVIAGMACGLAALTKPFWLLFVLAAAIPIWFGGRSRRGVLLTLLIAGCVAPIGVALLWFAAHGALADFWQVHVLDAAAYASLVPVDRPARLVESLASTRAGFLIVPVALYGGLVLWRSNRVAAGFFLSWILIVLGGVWLQGRFFAYHWLPLMPAVAILAVMGLRAMASASVRLAMVTVVVLIGLVAAPVLYEEVRFVSWLGGRTSTEAYYDAYGQAGPEMRAVAWMSREARPGKIFVFGWNAGIAWLTGRDIVSRFGFSMPLLSGTDDMMQRYRAEALAALERDPPTYFIEGDISPKILGRSPALADVPDLAAFVARGYREVARLGSIVIRERRVE
jgi:4-amino-4-deoxy-L-arabinose transferase-like glycosyltransferase